MRGVEAAEDPHDQAIAAYGTRLAHHHCGDLGSRHRPASIGRGHKEENDWHGSFHHRFGGRAAAIHRVPKRPEVCVVVPVTILLHSDRATCGGDGRAICCGDGHEPVTATACIGYPGGYSYVGSRSPIVGDCVGVRGRQSREQIAAAAWMIAGSPATLQRCPMHEGDGAFV